MSAIAEWLVTWVGTPLGILANALTVGVAAAGLIITQRRWMAFSLRRSRLTAFNKAGAPAIAGSAVARRIRDLIVQDEFNVAGEMDWLSTTLSTGRAQDRSLPLILPREDLITLARGYELHAAQLNSRVLLSANQVPLVAQSIELSQATTMYLRALAAGTTIGGGCVPTVTEEAVHVPHRGITIRSHVFPDRASRTVAYDLTVSYRHHLTAPKQGDHPWLDTDSFPNVTWLPTTEEERARLSKTFTGGHFFDGILPRLVHWELQYDGNSGRSRIHLALAACSYSAVILDHYPAEPVITESMIDANTLPSRGRGVRSSDDVHGAQVGVLTLSLVPVTRDGYLVLVERSRSAGSHEGLYGPAVNGNLELRARAGTSPDVDAFGIPDPRRALAREAREELGLNLAPEAISVTGLVSFDAPTERGTNVLMGTAMLPLTMKELQAQCDQADLVEGRWELGLDILGIRLPQNDDERARVAQWLLNSPRLTPHASAAALAALTVLQDMPPIATIPIDPDVPAPSRSSLLRLPIR